MFPIAHAGTDACMLEGCVNMVNSPVSIKDGLRTADCGLRTADCGLRTADCGPDWVENTDWV